jgi:CDP-6-deoxy-D-xylo-4-hexulose-3-dehydrase
MIEENKSKIFDLIRQIVKEKKESKRFVPGETFVQYSGDVVDENELIASVGSLIDGRLAFGKKVEEFEKRFAEYLGSKYTVSVSTGSDACLLSLQSLMNPHLDNPVKPGDEAIVCALNFATPVSSLVFSRIKPVFLDVMLGNYTIDTSRLEEAITEKTKIIIATHIFGSVCNMDKIMEVAKKHNLYVIEDCCDAHGSLYEEKKVGSIGDLGAFSFYPAHGMTMGGEGGIVSTSNEMLAYIVSSLKMWGRAMPCPEHGKNLMKDCKLRHNMDLDGMENYDMNYLFTNLGFNSKITEVQGAFGLEQLKKLDAFNKIRDQNFDYVVKALKSYEDVLILPEPVKKAKPAWYTIPLTIRPGAKFSREELLDTLSKAKIEYRNLFTGNILKQPGFKKIDRRVVGLLANADLTTTNSFFVGCYQGITPDMREYIVQTMTSFLDKHK